MLFFVALLTIANGVVAASRSQRPRWLALVLPVVIGVCYYLLWRHELHADGGDPQPGLIKAEGIALVALSLVAVLVGWLYRSLKHPREQASG